MAERDAAQLDGIRASLFGCCSLHPVARFEQDIHDLTGLELLRRALFESSPVEPTGTSQGEPTC
jgi:hypothetical protein